MAKAQNTVQSVQQEKVQSVQKVKAPKALKKNYSKTFFMPTSPDSNLARTAKTLPLFRRLKDAETPAAKRKFKSEKAMKVTISW